AGSAAHIDFATRTLSTIDYGASAITACAGGALVVMLGRRWLRWGAVVFVLCGLVLHHQLADWEHLVAFSVGTAIATFGGRARPAPRRSQLVSAGLIALMMFLGIVAAGNVLSGVSRGVDVVETRYPTPSTGGDRRVVVVLPENYDETQVDYPVVEFLHGRPGKPDDLFVNADLLGLMAK